jgi:hypothetical protein
MEGEVELCDDVSKDARTSAGTVLIYGNGVYISAGEATHWDLEVDGTVVDSGEVEDEYVYFTASWSTTDLPAGLYQPELVVSGTGDSTISCSFDITLFDSVNAMGIEVTNSGGDEVFSSGLRLYSTLYDANTGSALAMASLGSGIEDDEYRSLNSEFKDDEVVLDADVIRGQSVFVDVYEWDHISDDDYVGLSPTFDGDEMVEGVSLTFDAVTLVEFAAGRSNPVDVMAL